jgi:hypothetical protein
MSRHYIVVDTAGNGYRLAQVGKVTRLFSVRTIEPHGNAAGLGSATVFPTIGHARRAVAAECAEKERLWSSTVADAWYASIRLLCAGGAA